MISVNMGAIRAEGSPPSVSDDVTRLLRFFYHHREEIGEENLTVMLIVIRDYAQFILNALPFYQQNREASEESSALTSLDLTMSMMEWLDDQ